MSEQVRSTKPRAYRMDGRAKRVDATRQRIVEATVELHGSVGPAQTSIVGIAERAGVTRLTVYRHFPDEDSLYAACSAHWLSQQRVPRPDAWLEITDPNDRLKVGLADLYRFYRQGESMLVRLMADKASLPDAVRVGLDAREARFQDVLLGAFPRRSQTRELRAVVGHAVSFWTWRSLCINQGLSNRSAVAAMTKFAKAAGNANGGTN
ncbi:MAG: TetR/AcrR family transcriptional regulator [Candidatus Nanopelagicales bacterium]